jgi:hypothetical protein
MKKELALIAANAELRGALNVAFRRIRSLSPNDPSLGVLRRAAEAAKRHESVARLNHFVEGDKMVDRASASLAA